MKYFYRAIAVFAACVGLQVMAEEPAKPVPHKTGQFTCRFKEYSKLSNPREMRKRFRTKLDLGSQRFYNLEKESFSVYVPKDYQPWQPYGVVVWVNSGDGGGIPGSWKAVMDSEKLIWVGANMIGNKHSTEGRRMPLSLDGLHNIKMLYTIDPSRVYVSGNSGGGRVSSLMVAPFADEIKGGLFVVGVNFWENIPVPNGGGAFWPAGLTPSAKYLSIAKREGRYVLLTGDRDFNRNNTRMVYEKGFKKVFRKRALYIQVSGMGHTNPKGEFFLKAISFLDKQQEPYVKTNLSMAKRDESKKKYGKAMVNYFLAGTKGHKEGIEKSEALWKRLEDGTAVAEKLYSEKKYYEAHKEVTALVEGYGSTADKAGALLKILTDDKQIKKEIKAMGYLVKAKKCMTSKSRKTRKKGQGYLKKIVGKYDGTPAAKEAQGLLDAKSGS